MRKSRISKEKQQRLLEHFVAGTTASYYQRLREIIAHQIEQEYHEVFDQEREKRSWRSG